MPSRYLCSVLDEMRKMYETHNYSAMLGAIEEVQRMANRMEAALDDKRAIEDYATQASSLNRDIKAKRKELKAITQEVIDLKDQKIDLQDEIKRIKTNDHK